MNHSTPPRPLQHVKTGEFSETFAQEAADRRKAYTCARSGHESHRPQESFLPSSRRQGRDVEETLCDRKNDNVVEREWVSTSFRLSCYRRPHKSAEQMIILGTEGPEESHNTTDGDLRWIESRDELNPFGSFTANLISDLAATADSSLSPEGREKIRQWLMELETSSTREVFNGRVMKPFVNSLNLDDPRSTTTVSCAFFCFPFFRHGSGYLGEIIAPTLFTRPLVQALYRSESPLERETLQAAARVGGSEPQIMHVSQFWGFIMNNSYFASFSPSQVHSRPGSSITMLPLTHFPPSFRLHLQWNLTFLIYWDECSTWFRFLVIVHYIYSHLLQMHVDVELCTYHSHAPHETVDAHAWPQIMSKPHTNIFDIFVKLPNEALKCKTSGYQSLYRKRYTKALDAFGIPWKYDYDLRGRNGVTFDDDIDSHLESRIRGYTELRSRLQKKQESEANTELPPLPSLNYPESSSDPRGSRDIRKRRSISTLIYRDSPSPPRMPVLIDERDVRPPLRRAFSNRRYDRPRVVVRTSSGSDDSDSIYEGSMTASWNRTPCSWPACFGQAIRSKTPKFWSPRLAPSTCEELIGKNTNAPSVTRSPTTQPRDAPIPQQDLGTSDVSVYFKWKVHRVDTKTSKQDTALSIQLKATNTNSEPLRNPRVDPPAWAKDNDESTPLTNIHRDLTDGWDQSEVYISQGTATLEDVHDKLRSFDGPESMFVRDLVRSAVILSGHFVETELGSGVELKFYDCLLSILKKSQDYRFTEAQESIIEWANERISSMLELSSSIRAGVLGDDSCLFLLNSLVDCFKSIVLAFCLLNDYLRVSFEDLKNAKNAEERPTTEDRADATPNTSGSDHDGSDSAPQGTNQDLEIARQQSTNLQSISRPSTPEDIERELNTAMNTLIRAKEETIVLLGSGKQKGLAEYPTVSADRLIVAVLRFLAKGDTGVVTPVDLYRDYFSELRLTVRDAPKRLLLDDLDRTEEELDSLLATTYEQLDVLTQLQGLHFHIWTGLDDWNSSLKSIGTELNNNIDSYRDLQVRVENMRKQVLRQIEVKQDGQDKAILVFTIVTVVFLPLSFVSNFFGMNTADIRDMDHSQAMFWATSIPITVIIVSFAMVIAYKGTKIREFLSRST